MSNVTATFLISSEYFVNKILDASVLCDNADALLDEKTIIMFLKQSPRVLLDDHTF